MELTAKLEILADAAKCDASCAGSGATSGMGIAKRLVELRRIRDVDLARLRCSMKKSRRSSLPPITRRPAGRRQPRCCGVRWLIPRGR